MIDITGTSRSTVIAACSASRSTRTSRPTATSTCSTPRRRPVAAARAEDVAADADQGQPRRHGRERRRIPRRCCSARPDCAVPAAGQRRRLHAVDSDSHSIGTVRADPDGTLWVGIGRRRELRRRIRTALRTYDEASLAGKILHIDRDGHGLPATRSAPARPTSRTSARSCTRRASATRSASSCGRAPARSSATSAGTPPRRSTSRQPWRQLRLAVLGGPGPDARLQGPRRVRLPLRDHPHRDAPVYSYGHDGWRRCSGPGPRLAASRYPAACQNTFFVGDYVQGWLRLHDRQRQDQERRTFAPRASTASTSSSPRRATSPTCASPTARSTAPASSGSSIGNLRRPRSLTRPRRPAPRRCTVAFSADVSVDPDGDSVTYDWDFGDGSAAATRRTATTSTTPPAATPRR